DSAALISALYLMFKESNEERLRKPVKEWKREEIEPRAKDAACKFFTTLSLVIVYQTVKHVEESVGLELLNPTFKKVVEDDGTIANRIFDLAISLDVNRSVPTNKVESLHSDLDGKFFSQSLVRILA